MSGINGDDAGREREWQDDLCHWYDEVPNGHASSSPVMTATFCLLDSASARFISVFCCWCLCACNLVWKRHGHIPGRMNISGKRERVWWVLRYSCQCCGNDLRGSQVGRIPAHGNNSFRIPRQHGLRQNWMKLSVHVEEVDLQQAWQREFPAVIRNAVARLHTNMGHKQNSTLVRTRSPMQVALMSWSEVLPRVPVLCADVVPSPPSPSCLCATDLFHDTLLADVHFWSFR